MSISRLAGLALLAIVVASVALVPTASAAPEFNPSNKNILIITLYSLPLIIIPAAALDIHCLKALEHALILLPLQIEHVYFHFLNCVTIDDVTGHACPVSSEGAPEGLILTKTLKGILGLILPSHGVGILYLPASGKEWFTLAASGACDSEETAVSGAIAAEVTPTGKSQLTDKHIFALTSGKQAISDIDVDGGGLVKPRLIGFAAEAFEAMEGISTASQVFEIT